ncbi:uncharacterized protein J4E79_008748 [Alternaria viburni]|uniref:uncharacterized protein n=1 Tax=Alternaria viburni TaxID=566460 RepID=UPI0020C2551B|nr:uncharacterized protein J4E79_008748 [Alternaria viburni]KAI4653234.1 hypothetical protein J4E79_008748 [Alternaria viburni]
MADPFSITGSAVGVVSLAIQVCKGLEWYLSGVKEAKNKAEQIAAETEELANLLEQLESVIGKVDPSQSVSATRTGIVSCANAIATIRKKLKPDDQAANSGIKSSLKRLTKRLAFPFKEADITYWKDVLSTIQQSLQTALLALVIDQQRLASEDARLHYTQLSVDQSIRHFSNLQLQRDVFDATSLQLAGQSHMLESGFSATSHSLQSLHSGIHSLQAKLDEISLMEESTLQTDVINLRSLHRKDRRLKRRYAKLSCTCRPQTSALGYRTGLFALTCTRTSTHDTGCPQAPLQNAVTDLQLQATLCSLLLGKKVLLSFQLSYGAGLSVKQNLKCHRVVHWSPAFEFAMPLVESSFKMPMDTFRGEVEKLLRMFQLKQADFHTGLLEFLFEQDLQITRNTYKVAARNSQVQLAFFAGIRYENFVSPLLDDSELLEAVVMKSGHQLRGLLHQPRILHALDTETLTDALVTSTVTDWVDGCRVLLDANFIPYLGDPISATRYRRWSLLSISAVFNRLDMLQFWLAQREECDEQQLNLIGYIEDALSLAQGPRSGIPMMDVIQLLLSHLIKQRHENRISARDLGNIMLYAPNVTEKRHVLFTGAFLDLTLWVEKAANTLELSRLIHGYIRLFVFSYLEIRHTCCDIGRIQHEGNPDYNIQPYPRYAPKELRRITNEDAHLRARLEQLVPELITRHESFGGKLQDFVIEVLIPTMRRTAKELKEEDKTLYAAGRRELGVVMDEDEDEDDSEEESSEVEEEEMDAEEESDDEY